MDHNQMLHDPQLGPDPNFENDSFKLQQNKNLTLFNESKLIHFLEKKKKHFLNSPNAILAHFSIFTFSTYLPAQDEKMKTEFQTGPY